MSRSLRAFPALALLLVFAAISCCASRLSATTFYVDCDHGKDSASGRSLKSTWQHLDAVNSFALKEGFHPGDSILLKRGCRWHEQLELLNSNKSGPLTNSGKDGAPITISAYGIGDLPTIDGADSVTGWRPAGPSTCWDSRCSRAPSSCCCTGCRKPARPVRSPLRGCSAG